MKPVKGWTSYNETLLKIDLNLPGAEDLKGHVMKLRGDMMRSTRNCELEALGIQVIIEQAAHELKYGDPRVKFVYKLIMNALTNLDAIIFEL